MFVSKTVRFSQILSVGEMIFIIRSKKYSRDQSCQMTPCQNCYLWKLKFFFFFTVFSHYLENFLVAENDPCEMATYWWWSKFSLLQLLPLKGKNYVLVVLKTIDRLKLSTDEMILMIIPTKVLLESRLSDNSFLEIFYLKGKHFTRWAIQAPGRLLLAYFINFMQNFGKN